MNKYFNPKTEFTRGYLNEAGIRLFPSVDELAKKFGVSRSSLFKKCRKEGWHSERLQFQKKLAVELSEQAIASSINKAETIDTSILRIAARGLQLVEESLYQNGSGLTATEIKHNPVNGKMGPKAANTSYKLRPDFVFLDERIILYRPRWL